MTQKMPSLPAVSNPSDAPSETRYSSLTLVDDENKIREEAAELAGVPFPSKEFAKVEHADFLKKVREVLGVDAGKFSGVYLGGNGEDRPCYYLPKRESCLMAMSYSYALQAKVFDHWVEAEAKLADISNLNSIPTQDAQAIFESAVRLTQTAMLSLTNARAERAMLSMAQDPAGLTPKEVVQRMFAMLEMYNKNAKKFLSFDVPDVDTLKRLVPTLARLAHKPNPIPLRAQAKYLELGK